MRKTISIVLAFIFLGSLLLISCSRQASFGSLVIASEISPSDFSVLAEEDTFDIDSYFIYAVIRVSDAYSQNKWRFVWKDAVSGVIILDRSDYYDRQNRQYIDGNISTYISLDEGEKAILPPGKYEVSFYHEDVEQASSAFEIRPPELKIEDVVFSKKIDDNMEPLEITDDFSSSDVVYVFLRTNYRLPENKLTVKYYGSDGNLLLSSDIHMEEYFLDESFSVFSLSGKSGLLAPDDYDVEVYLNDELFGVYGFRVQAFPEDIRYLTQNIYENDEYLFTIKYPDGWEYSQEIIDSVLKVDFIPPEPDMGLAMLMHVIKKGNFPSRDELILFAKEYSEEIADENGFDLLESKDTKKTLNDEIDYDEFIFEYLKKDDESAWSAIFSFVIRDDLYILMNLSEDSYRKAGASMHASVLESIEFK